MEWGTDVLLHLGRIMVSPEDDVPAAESTFDAEDSAFDAEDSAFD